MDAGPIQERQESLQLGPYCFFGPLALVYHVTKSFFQSMDVNMEGRDLITLTSLGLLLYSEHFFKSTAAPDLSHSEHCLERKHWITVRQATLNIIGYRHELFLLQVIK
jgi:hypothetical protein